MKSRRATMTLSHANQINDEEFDVFKLFTSGEFLVSCSVNLMKDCWHENPNERPTFTDIVSELDKFINIYIDERLYDDTILPDLASSKQRKKDNTQTPGQILQKPWPETQEIQSQIDEDSLLGAVGGIPMEIEMPMAQVPSTQSLYRKMISRQRLAEGHLRLALAAMDEKEALFCQSRDEDKLDFEHHYPGNLHSPISKSLHETWKTQGLSPNPHTYSHQTLWMPCLHGKELSCGAISVAAPVTSQTIDNVFDSPTIQIQAASSPRRDLARRERQSNRSVTEDYLKPV